MAKNTTKDRMEASRQLQVMLHRLPPEQQAAAQKWLATAKTVVKVCRDKGHWWPEYVADDTTVRRERVLGANAFNEGCQREIDGEHCGVRRERYVSITTGGLPKANKYDYTQANGYLLPGDKGGGLFGSKEMRGLIRLSLGLDVEVEE